MEKKGRRKIQAYRLNGSERKRGVTIENTNRPGALTVRATAQRGQFQRRMRVDEKPSIDTRNESVNDEGSNKEDKGWWQKAVVVPSPPSHVAARSGATGGDTSTAYHRTRTHIGEFPPMKWTKPALSRHPVSLPQHHTFLSLKHRSFSL